MGKGMRGGNYLSGGKDMGRRLGMDVGREMRGLWGKGCREGDEGAVGKGMSGGR